jgi:hypothetical protein
MIRMMIASMVAIGLASPAWAQETKSSKRTEERAALEKKFVDVMNSAVLEGSFTIDGRNSDKPPPKDKYIIDSVQKSGGDVWVITARMVYGNVDVKIPVPVEVRWAGDTAVIMLTNVSLPGMQGKFSTRLLIDGDRYAGTWSHDKVGGHMWGKIKKQTPAAKSAESKEKSSN